MTFTQIISKYKTHIIVIFDSEWGYIPRMYVSNRNIRVIKSNSRINTLYNKYQNYPYFYYLLEYYASKKDAILHVIRGID